MDKALEIPDIIQQLFTLFQQNELEKAQEFLAKALEYYKHDNQILREQLRQMKKHQFGRRSEKISSAQLSIFESLLAQAEESKDDEKDNQEEEHSPLTEQEWLEVKSYRRRRKQNEKGKLDTSKLPQETVIHKIDADKAICPSCSQVGEIIGYEESKEIVHEPAKFKLVIHKREKVAFSCSCEECKGVITAKGPSKPIEKSVASFDLLSEIVVSKYQNHIPLERQRRIFARDGLLIPLNVMVDWVGKASDLLEPLAKKILKKALNSHVLQTDDTRVTVLDPKVSGGSKRGHLWTYVGDNKWIGFDFTPDWKSQRPRELLQARNVNGKNQWVQADGYKGYDVLFKLKEDGLKEVGCWSHCHRKFFDALDTDKRSAKPLTWIKQLYRLEDLASAQNLNNADREKLRQQRSGPVLRKFEKWLAVHRDQIPPKDPLGKAISYAMNQWEALQQFMKDGALSLDNNAAERALRRVAIGRGNWMFAGSDIGGHRAAILYTIIATAEQAKIDVRAYISSVMRQVSEGWKAKRVEELLPDIWQPPDSKEDTK